MAAPLTDRFGRVHTYLRISLTERCNLRCTYCMPEEGVPLTPSDRLMKRNEILDIAGLFVKLGIHKIRLTGGEPLLRKDCPQIIEGLSSLPVALTITTNAVLIDRYLEVLRKSSIKTLNVSLDSLREERFRKITKRKDFQRIRANIDLLLREGFELKINAVLMKGVNEDEILHFIEWTKDQKLDIRFIEFMPFNGNRWEWEKIFPYREFLDLVSKNYRLEQEPVEAHATSRMFRVQGYRGRFGMISSMTNHFCGSCNRLRLTADGKLRNCLFSREEIDLLTPFRNGEDIEPLIREAVLRKKAKHGGIKDLQAIGSEDQDISSRSMILIGG